MDKKHSLWLRPFGDTAFRLEQYIKKLSKEYGTPVFEPHITLLNGIVDTEIQLIQFTKTLAASFHPFDLVLTNAGYKDYYYQSLFIHVEKSSELQSARNIAERLFECNYDKEFFPHLSLMYGDLTPEEKERILNKTGREFHLRFSAHSLLLVQTEGKPDQWKKVYAAEFSEKD